MLSVLHAEVGRALDGVAAEQSAAEAHGCLCGALCADDEYSLPQWLADVAPEAGQDGETGLPAPVLGLLYRSTADSLRGDALEFTPLLPDDDVALDRRTEALAQWAQGFLYGLAAAEIGRRPDLPDNVSEILRDFAEIGRATLRGDEETSATGPAVGGDEADEAAFAELYEFVRVGVQLVYDELLPLRRA